MGPHTLIGGAGGEAAEILRAPPKTFAHKKSSPAAEACRRRRRRHRCSHLNIMITNETTSSSSLRRRRSGTSPAPSYDSADESAGAGGGGGIASAVTSEATRYLVRRRQMSEGGGSSSVHADESRLRKFLTRLISGLIMISLFVAILLSGHAYVCGLVFVLEVLLFRELVTVRYNAHFDRIDSNIPLFRTTQWMWFSVSLFYVYSEFAVEMIKSNTKLHDDLLGYAQLAPVISFALYAGTFVLTISTMQTGHIRFQLNQLCWTIVVLCLTVGQLKYIMHNVYNGLIWFTLPILLVITNDVMAYFSGITCGRKFITRPFMELSPNKTWEGFIGGGVFTLVVGWYLSRFLAGWTWMTCPTNTFDLFPGKLECEVENVFHEATTYFPSQAFELLPRALIRLWPANVVEVCSVAAAADLGDAAPGHLLLRPCISGAISQKHHHWELALSIVPIQLHALSLSLFASLVAPFGGFLASGIKRAYRIKDFDSIIPGHGGLMDRFDCQLIMALGACTTLRFDLSSFCAVGRARVRFFGIGVSRLLGWRGFAPSRRRRDAIAHISHPYLTTTLSLFSHYLSLFISLHLSLYCPLLGSLLFPFARSSSLPTAALRAFLTPQTLPQTCNRHRSDVGALQHICQANDRERF